MGTGVVSSVALDRQRSPLAIAVLLVAALVTLLPLISMFLTALQPRGSAPEGLSFPSDPQWGNFADAWEAAAMGRLLGSSSLIVLGVVPVSLALATMAGFGLAHVPFRGARGIFALFLVGLTLPFEALIAPLYLQMDAWGLLNSRWAIVLPLIALFMPFSVFWMRAHFLNLPTDLLDSTRVDGASSWQAFRHVFMPLAAPAWSSLAILLFLWTWNQFLLAVTLVDDPTKRTMAGALGAFQGQYGTDIVLLCAGSLLIIVPTVVVFVVFQRSFVSAILQGTDR